MNSILAGPGFPASGFVLSGGGAGFQAISIVDVEFDLARRAAGALHFDNALRVHLDRAYVHHYREFGIQVVGGHEVHVSNSWFGECASSRVHKGVSLSPFLTLSLSLPPCLASSLPPSLRPFPSSLQMLGEKQEAEQTKR